MDFIAGYESVKKLKEVSGYIFYKAVSSESKQKVIIASFRHQLSPSQCVSLKQAFSICEPIELSNVLFPLDLELSDETVFLVFEDTGAIFLPLLQSKGAFGLEVFFDVAIKVSEILTQLHDKHLFHGDLRPINILYDEINKQVVLSGICYHPKIEKFFDIFPLTPLFEAYVYTSPEQTGRVNWEVDQRSDLYSLGIIFYEMVCGCVPFRGETPDQRIFGHLAVTPPELYQFCPILPKMVNQVIRKLLSKGMGDRYQSVFGLLKDLERCQKEYLDKKTISDFELGSSDLMNQYHIPTRLYGSQENFTLLLESLNRVCEGNIELATIQGAAGTGKSSLVLELIDAVYQKKGFVAKGKFEKEYIDTPYYPLINAFKGIIRQILTEKDVDIDKWKERFLTNIGKNGQILIDFIPEIEIIIGEQPPLPNLDPLESKKRFNHLFAKFIQSFSYRGKPFLIVLDNFHWADAASIQFIQNFLSDPGNRYVLVVIIYREGAFEQNHTFFVALTELRNLGIRIQEIKLSPLTVEDIGVFIKDSLGVKQNYRSLSQLIFEKSRGNPFFVRQLLQSLYEKKQITFDVTTSKWHWEIKQIKQLEIFEDVVVLITDKINELPGELIEILKIAACVGFEFDINILEFITGKDNDEIAALLELPLKSGLILPKTKSWEQSDRQVSFISKSNIKKIKNFQFLHSRIHQAAYSLLSSQEKKQNHLKIGRIILSNTKSKDLKTNPYQIVNQLNQAIILLTKRSEKLELAKLNLTAGILSKASAAHDSAWKYFAYGTDLLDEKSWQTDYELTKELYLGRSECEYYSGNTEAAKPIFTLLLEHVHTIEEKVEVIIRKLNLLIKNGELKEAIQTGISALKDLFSEKIPVNDAEVTIISQVMMQEMQSDLEISNVEKLFFLPSMKKSEEIMIMELITNIIPAAYIAKRHLWILLTIKMVQKSLKHGNCFYSSYGYMNLAVILCSGLEDYQTGYAIGKLALKLNEKYQDPRLLAKLYFLFGSYINHWKNDAHENLDYLNKAYQVGVDLGDWISAGNSLKFLIKTHLFIGTPIEQVIKELEVHQDFVEQYDNPEITSILEIGQQIKILNSDWQKESKISNDHLQGRNLLKILEKSKNVMLLQWYYLLSAKLHFIFDDYDNALKLIIESDKRIAGYSQHAVPEHYFYYSMIIAANYNLFSLVEKKRYWDILKNNHLKLKKFSEDCSINFKDKYQLVSAQMAVISGNFVEAFNWFDEAIMTASTIGLIQNLAIANETAAKYFLSRKKMTVAKAYLKEAHHAYIKWGASAKAKQLETSYPVLLQPLMMAETVGGNHSFASGGTSKQDDSDYFDYSRFVTLFQNISTEVVLDNLLEKILKLFMENAGAQKGYFLIEMDGRFDIRAEGIMERTPPIRVCDYVLDDFESIAQRIVFYVYRTKKYLVLDDASQQGMFMYDPYINKKKVKSILCIPAIHHGNVNGILYLENNLVSGAFSSRRVKLLDLLISQVAFLIENSLLYSNLSKMNEELSSSKAILEDKIKFLKKELMERKSKE